MTACTPEKIAAALKDRARSLSWRTWPRPGTALTDEQVTELHDMLMAGHDAILDRERLSRALAEARAVCACLEVAAKNTAEIAAKAERERDEARRGTAELSEQLEAASRAFMRLEEEGAPGRTLLEACFAHVITLSSEEWAKFMEIMDNPPPPTPALIEAVKLYRQWAALAEPESGESKGGET